ncbi:MAG: type I-E CRISPR-associated protein Cas6/Cse3/CasE [Bacteroidetes bacterium]|jgi:CRISPR system Cascade subunit CasE|nr:type I-E CRISPR-associated protein Cas6/Cse3/CasE [Bacteroidota bacterium]
MVQCWLDAKGLTQLGRMLRLPLRRTDTNYLVHCAIGELFRDDAPKPFSIENESQNGRQVRVLGYTETDADTLQTSAQVDASPTVYSICDWDRMAAKPMPETFPEGMGLQFELRACPVIRKSSAGEVETRNGTRSWSEGEEVDAFLNRAWHCPDEELSREQVYRDWLRRQFDIRGGARVERVRMERFSIERMTRRDHSGGGTTQIKRPDVTLTGTLTVTDPEAFMAVLRSGVGRHKTFGFGMLKIRRA